MFWLVTASVVRGKLPQAQEAISTLLQMAQTRDDQPALLNAMRGQGMIHLFMGNVVDAHSSIERAIGVFSATEEVNRLAARAAGQDAGVANLALMSWVLWALGHMDQAIIRIEAALHRADQLTHPHTQAYAYYYASILYALRGERAMAHDFAKRCLAFSHEHEFRQWLGLSRAVMSICAATPEDAPGLFEHIMGVVDEYHRRGYQLGVTALHVLLCPALFLGNQPAQALEVVKQGLSIVSANTERIFEAELYRLKAQHLLLCNAPDARKYAETLLDQATMTAKARALARWNAGCHRPCALWASQGRREEAHHLLGPVYAAFSGDMAPKTSRREDPARSIAMMVLRDTLMSMHAASFGASGNQARSTLE